MIVNSFSGHMRRTLLKYNLLGEKIFTMKINLRIPGTLYIRGTP